MSEKGIVIDIKNGGDTAVVEFNRTEACAKCRACMAGFKESQMILEAKNDAGAKTGDTVFIALPQNGLLAASFIMYMLPLAAMFLGFISGQLLEGVINITTDILSFFLGISMLAVSFLIIRANERKFKSLPIFLPHVSKIADKGGN